MVVAWTRGPGDHRDWRDHRVCLFVSHVRQNLIKKERKEKTSSVSGFARCGIQSIRLNRMFNGSRPGSHTSVPRGGGVSRARHHKQYDQDQGDLLPRVEAARPRPHGLETGASERVKKYINTD